MEKKKYIKKKIVIFLCFLYCLSKNKLSGALDIFSRYCIGCREGLMRVCLDVTGYENHSSLDQHGLQV